MNVQRFIQRICQIAIVALLLAIVVLRFYVPKIREEQALKKELAQKTLDFQREAEELRLLRLKQEKLREDPEFLEKIARENLGYTKPGETLFLFKDEDAP
ncbi:MAG: septum formation initiator family protein [Kiritimatiellae bacterium]|nr:septum formation initiator family protein [Kiritimatiellia bacterium]